MENFDEMIRRHLPRFNVGDVVYRLYEDRPWKYVVVGVIFDTNVTVNLMEPRWLYFIVPVDRLREMKSDSHADVSRVIELSGREIEDGLTASIGDWKWEKIRALQRKIDDLRKEMEEYEKEGKEEGDE